MIANPFDAGNYTVVPVTNEMVPVFFSPHPRPVQCTAGLPAGAKLVGVQQDWAGELWHFFFLHESFPWVLRGEDVPITTPTYRAYFDARGEE